MLYPLKFVPRLLEKIWGGRKLETVLGKKLPQGKLIGESWELYDFPPGVVDDTGQWASSEVANGPLAGRTLHSLIEEFGRALHGDVPLVGEGQFPLLIKFLDARENLSVQVHPDEAYTRRHKGTHLKNEAWYIVQSDPGARLFKGLAPGVTRERFASAIERGAVEEVVQTKPVKPGQCFYLPSGAVHALGEGILVAEVQTPSDTTFRVFDFGRIDPSTGQPRTLHVAEALECIDFSSPPEPPQQRSHVAGLFTTVSRLVTCPWFTMEKVRFTEGVEEAVPYDQPVVWMMLEGEAQLKVDNAKTPTPIAAGDTVLLPAEMKNPTIRTIKDCVWLEITMGLKK